MSKNDLVSEEVLQELINKLEEIVNNYCYNLEYYTPTDIEGFFDGTQQEIDYYSSLIKAFLYLYNCSYFVVNK